jgi:hypothetical protein
LHAVQIGDPVVHEDDLGGKGFASGFAGHV